VKKDPRVYLAQILEAIQRIETFTAEGRAVFLQSRLHQDAVIRNFEIIGEATKRVPDDYRNAHPEVPWRKLAAFRDVLIHGYDVVDVSRVWLAVEGDLPALKMALLRILPPLDQLEAELAGDDQPPDD
jgi:uncharacterized protein with HEPN domain